MALAKFEKKKIIITGTGRCGSRFLFVVLTDCGLKLGRHEVSHGPDGGMLNFGWNGEIHDQGLVENIEQHIQVGLVREPIACIASLTTGTGGKGPTMHRTNYYKTIPGIIWPNDWDELPLEERKKRLDRLDSLGLGEGN